jgi:hypothetical protein
MATQLTPRRPPRMTKKWEPKKWDPIYEQFVAMSSMGLSNVAIAERFGYTPVHVSNVLNSIQGQRLKKIILDRLRATVSSSIPERLEDIADKTVDRLRDVVTDEELFKRSPFAVIDRGLAVLKGLRHLKGDAEHGNMNVEKAIVLSNEAAKLITEGLEKSRQAEEIHGTVVEDHGATGTDGQ